MKRDTSYHKWIREEISEAQLTINFCRDLIHNKNKEIKILRSHLGYVIPNPRKIKGFKFVYTYRQLYFTNLGIAENIPKRIEYTNICTLLHDLKVYKKYLDTVWSKFVKITNIVD